MNDAKLLRGFSHFKTPVYAEQQHDDPPPRPESWPLRLLNYYKDQNDNYVITFLIPDRGSVPALQNVKAQTWVRTGMCEAWKLSLGSLDELVKIAREREIAGLESTLREEESAWLASFPNSGPEIWRKNISKSILMADLVKTLELSHDYEEL